MKFTQLPFCRIIPPQSNSCDINLINTHFDAPTAQTGHNGVGLYGQEDVQILECRFSNANMGLFCYNPSLGFGLAINNSYFDHCNIAIQTYSRHLILYNVEFLNCHSNWLATAMTGTSGIQNVLCQSTANSNVKFQGNATLLGETSTILSGINGIWTDGAIGRFRCINVLDQTDAGIYIRNGSTVTMNATWPNNDISSNATSIKLWEAGGLNLNNGENDLRPDIQGAQSVINGSMLCPSGTNINANMNFWKNGGTAPTVSDYSLQGICTPLSWAMTITDNFPLSQVEPCIITEGGLAGEGENLGMGESIYSPSDDMSNSELTDLINLLDESSFADLFFHQNTENMSIFQSQSEMPVNLVDLQNGLIDHIQNREITTENEAALQFSAVQGIFEIFNRIKFTQDLEFQSQSSSSKFPMELHEILANKSSEFYDEGFRDIGFYSAILAAEILHSNQQLEEALAYLSSGINSPLSENNQFVLNRFICQMTYELNSVFPDLNEVNNEILLCDNLNDENPKNAGGEKSKEAKGTENSFALFPNPAQNVIHLQFDQNPEENYTIEIFNASGQQVYSKIVIDREAVSLNEFTNGLYLARLTTSLGEMLTSKFIVSK